MKKIFFSLLFTSFFLFNKNVNAQNADSTKGSSEQVFTIVEQMPEFLGGENKMRQFISEHLKYPETARNKYIQGRVVIQFTIFSDGSLGDYKIYKSIGSGCETAAIDVLKQMPNWTPGKIQGKPVAVKFVLPIEFSLN